MDYQQEFHNLTTKNGPIFQGEDWTTTNMNGILVHYIPKFNAGGSICAEFFVDFIKSRFPGKIFENMLEICSGAGFLGFACLGAGLCKKLTLVEILPDAAPQIEKTIEENNLQEKVNYFISDGMTQVPKFLTFDLVIGNPPWKYEADESYAKLKKINVDLLAYDLGYRFTRDFYHSIGDYVQKGCPILMSCGLPLDYNYFDPAFPGGSIDFRPSPPILHIKHFIDTAGLYLREVSHPKNTYKPFWFILSEKPEVDPSKTLII